MIARVNERIKADTRRALLAAAARAFSQSGFDRTSVDAVSEAAGLAKGTIYNYFPSKEVLFQTLLAEACELAARAADAAPNSAPTRVRLEAFVAGNLRWAKQQKALAVLFARELLGGDSRNREFILQAAAPCLEKLAAILRDGIDREEVSPHAPPEALALTFISLANLLLLQSWQASASWPSSDDFAGTATALFLDGVAGDRAPASIPPPARPAPPRSPATTLPPAKGRFAPIPHRR